MEAFESVLRPHLTALLTYSRAICGDYHAAQDVVQETALIAYRNLGRFFPDADFGTWLKAIARRQALAMRRTLGRHPLLADEALELAYDEESREETGSQEALRKCVEQLTTSSRELLNARYADGMGLEEVAAATNTNVDTLRWRMYRLRRGLRECVERRLAEKE